MEDPKAKAKEKAKAKTRVIKITVCLVIIIAILLFNFPQIRSYIPLTLGNRLSGKLKFTGAKSKAKAQISTTVIAQKTAIASQECQVNGILYSKKNSSVMINRRAHYLNDYVCGGRVVEITLDKVKINFQGREEMYGVGSVITPKANIDSYRPAETRRK